jgi:hypothetical protein
MKIPQEAHLETKVDLTCGSAQVMPTGKHAPALGPSAGWRHPWQGATVCR